MSDLSSAKRRVLDEVGNEPWLASVGIGLVGADRRKGLVVSITTRAPASARSRIESLVQDVPHDVRIVGNLRKLGA